MGWIWLGRGSATVLVYVLTSAFVRFNFLHIDAYQAEFDALLHAIERTQDREVKRYITHGFYVMNSRPRRSEYF